MKSNEIEAVSEQKNSLSGADNSKMRMVTPKILFEQFVSIVILSCYFANLNNRLIKNYPI
jgi:hypothetical protein